jgi:hypothetical protein
MTNQNRYIQWKTNNPDSYKELLRRRRERYKRNEEYRKRQLQHTAAWRKRKGKEGVTKKRTPKPKIFQVGEQEVECWSAGRTADFLNVDKKTISNLEKSGAIPTNHLVSANRRRWWPAEFVQWLKPYFVARKAGISAQEFHRRVWIGWSEEQVRGAIPVVLGEFLPQESSGDDQVEGKPKS